LKNDLYVFKLSKNLQREAQLKHQGSSLETEGQTEEETTVEGPSVNKNDSCGAIVDSDKMVTEQIQQTMEAI